MAAKVLHRRGAWWLVTHDQGDRDEKRIGPTAADRKLAEQAAELANHEIKARKLGLPIPGAASATSPAPPPPPDPLPTDAELRRWHATYRPTFKLSFERESLAIIERHLAPHFGARDLRELREADLLAYIGEKLERGRKTPKYPRPRSLRPEPSPGLAPATIRQHLSLLRRVCSLAVREGTLARNPAQHLGELLTRVGRAAALEVKTAEAWTRDEVARLLELAREHEPRFAPALALLFSTGLRRGELLGLKWEDVDFERRRLHVRRAYVRGEFTTPKSGKGRFVAIPPALAELLLELLAQRHREARARALRELEAGRPGAGVEVPAFVFPNERGGAIEEKNLARSWRRVQRHALAAGIRPLKLHATRHTWATLALASGKASIRWVADQLGHHSPEFTLRTYTHALRDEAPDLSFADFTLGDGAATALARRTAAQRSEKARRAGLASGRKRSEKAQASPSDPGRIRTCDPQLRRLVLYPG